MRGKQGRTVRLRREDEVKGKDLANFSSVISVKSCRRCRSNRII